MEVTIIHSFGGNEKFWPCRAFTCQVLPKVCENRVCQQLTGPGGRVAATGLGLLQVKVHPEVLSRDGVKQLYFEVLLWKHLKHSYVCDRVYRLLEKYLPDISECCWRKELPVHLSHLSPLLLAPGHCLAIAHVLCFCLGWHQPCTHQNRCCTDKGKKKKGCFLTSRVNCPVFLSSCRVSSLIFILPQ